MAILDKIRKNGTTYDIQDTSAREDIADLKSAVNILESETKIDAVDNSVPITWDSESDGKYIGADGTIGSSTNFHYSDLLDVINGKAYQYTFDVSGVTAYGCRIHGYDENGAWVEQITYKANIVSDSAIVFLVDNSNIKYIRISNHKNATSNKLSFYDPSFVEITWDDAYDGKYIGEDGSVGSSTNFHCTDLLNVNYNQLYVYTFISNIQTGFSTRIHGYNSNGQWVKQFAYRTAESSSATFEFLIDDLSVKYIRISNRKGLEDETLYWLNESTIPVNVAVVQLNEIVDGIVKTHWYGKTWYGYGTSITNTSSEGKYPTYLAQMSGMTFVNKGISGGGIGDFGATSQGQVYSAICNITDGKLDADLITLETGANDCKAGVPLGTIYDTGTETLAGCLNDCIRYLQSHTDAQICVFNSPAAKTEPTATTQYYEWAEMVRKICDINRVHFLNNNCNMGSSKIADSTKGSLYVVDNIHQTDLGGYIMAQNLWFQLRNIPLFYTAMPV